MKTPVAITLILVGALLILAPAIFDYLYQRNLVDLMSGNQFTKVSLDGEMSFLSICLLGLGFVCDPVGSHFF